MEALYDFVDNYDLNSETLTESMIDECYGNLNDNILVSDTNFPVDVSRLILKFLLIPTKREVITSKKCNLMKKIYLKLLLKTNFGFKEYLMIGKVILYFYTAMEKYGPNVLESSYFDLPLEKCYCYYKEDKPLKCSCSFSPSKYRIPIRSSNTLQDLLKFWVEVFNEINSKNLGQVGSITQLNTNCTPIFNSLLSILVSSSNNNMVSTKTFSSFLSVIHVNLNACEVSFDDKMQYTTDLLLWLNSILVFLIPGEKSKDDDNNNSNVTDSCIAPSVRRSLDNIFEMISNIMESIMSSWDIVNNCSSRNSHSNSQIIYLDFLEEHLMELLHKFLQPRQKELLLEYDNYHIYTFENTENFHLLDVQSSKVNIIFSYFEYFSKEYCKKGLISIDCFHRLLRLILYITKIKKRMKYSIQILISFCVDIVSVNIVIEIILESLIASNEVLHDISIWINNYYSNKNSDSSYLDLREEKDNEDKISSSRKRVKRYHSYIKMNDSVTKKNTVENSLFSQDKDPYIMELCNFIVGNKMGNCRTDSVLPMTPIEELMQALIPLEVSLLVSSKQRLCDTHSTKVLSLYGLYFKKLSSLLNLSSSSSYYNLLFMSSIHRIKIYSQSAYSIIQNQFIDTISFTTNQMNNYIIKLLFIISKTSKNSRITHLKMLDLINEDNLLTDAGLDFLDNSLMSFQMKRNNQNYDVNKYVTVLFDLISNCSLDIDSKILSFQRDLNLYTFVLHSKVKYLFENYDKIEIGWNFINLFQILISNLNKETQYAMSNVLLKSITKAFSITSIYLRLSYAKEMEIISGILPYSKQFRNCLDINKINTPFDIVCFPDLSAFHILVFYISNKWSNENIFDNKGTDIKKSDHEFFRIVIPQSIEIISVVFKQFFKFIIHAKSSEMYEKQNENESSESSDMFFSEGSSKPIMMDTLIETIASCQAKLFLISLAVKKYSSLQCYSDSIRILLKQIKDLVIDCLNLSIYHGAWPKLQQIIAIICLDVSFQFQQEKRIDSFSILSDNFIRSLFSIVGPGSLEKDNYIFSNIVLPGMMSFLRYSSLVCPEVGIIFLSEIVKIWLKQNTIYYLIRNEIAYFGACGHLSYLIITNIEKAVDLIINVIIMSDSSYATAILQVIEKIIDEMTEKNFIEIFGDLIFGKLLTINSFNISKINKFVESKLLSVYHNYLLKETKSIDNCGPLLYHYFKSDLVMNLNVDENLLRNLHRILSNVASRLAMKLSNSSNEGRLILKSTFDSNFIRYIWDLGSDLKDETHTMNGLGILCLLFSKSSWTDEVDRNRTIESYGVSSIPERFLYLMINMIQNDWVARSNANKEHGLKSLHFIISRLKESDLCKFLPKILIVVDNALGTPSFALRYAAVEIISKLCDILPGKTLTENLSSLIIGLIPVLEADFPIVSNELEEASKYLESWGNLKGNFYNTGIIFRHEKRNLSPDLSLLLNTAYTKFIREQTITKAKDLAVKIFRHVFVTRENDLNESIQGTAYIPDIVELKDISSSYVKKFNDLSFEHSIAMFCKMLKHESSYVRSVALKRIYSVCSDNLDQLYCMEDSDGSYIIPEIITTTIQELLQLTSLEIKEAVIIECAKCFGLFGAIDQERFRVKVVSVNKGREPANNESESFTPWNIELDTFGVYLLEYHLIPALRSSNEITQDRAGYAIQELLKLLSRKSRSNAASNDNKKPVLPESLKSILMKRSVYDIAEPFLSTDYEIKEIVRHPFAHFFRTGVPFRRWLSLWVRNLVLLSKESHLNNLFVACRGIIRSRIELAQFLLPHVIANILRDSALNQNDSNQISNNIVEEICDILVGKDNRDITDSESVNETFNFVIAKSVETEDLSDRQQMCIQSVFALLDKFSNWISLATQELQSPRDQSHNQMSITKSYLNSLTNLITQIPKDLLGNAAMKIKAYARALRYIETHAREITYNKKDDAKSKIKEEVYLKKDYDDHANNILPTFNTESINQLMIIYANFEDTDSLRGVQALKQIHGYQSNSFNRILEMEQSDEWIGALVEYDLQKNSEQYKGLCQQLLDPTLEMSFDSKEGNMELTQLPSIEVEKSESSNPLDTIAQIERGRLRCLLELGHLETVIDQTIGITDRYTDLEQSLIPLGVEASWKLTKWEDLESFIVKTDRMNTSQFTNAQVSMVPDIDNFQLSIGKLLLSMSKNDTSMFESVISEARKTTMGYLSAASMESYGRAYPLLTRLHILHEIDQLNSSSIGNKTFEASTKYWEQRLNLMSPSITQRSLLLAVRRSLLRLSNRSDLEAKNWLNVTYTLRDMGKVDMARVALRNAESCSLNPSIVMLEECKLLKESSQVDKALMILEPVEIDCDVILKICKTGIINEQLKTLEKRTELAERLQLATKLMVDSHQKHGRVIIDRYKAIIDLNENREEAFFEAARYYEYLYNESLNAKVENTQNSFVYIFEAINNYGKGLKIATKQKMQYIPRMLTLWFTFTAITKSNDSNRQTVIKMDNIKKVNKLVKSLVIDIPSDSWYICMSQIVSRVGHSNKETVGIIGDILRKVLKAFPKQSIWHLAGLITSLRQDRREIVLKIMADTMAKLSTEDQTMLRQAPMLFNSMIKLAGYECADTIRKLRWGDIPKITFSNFIVPTENILHKCNPLEGNSSIHSGSNMMFIQSFNSEVDVASSKAKPKTITVYTTCGKSVKFLCKKEKDGDLRKDARLMEFNFVVNRLFQSDPEARKRNLKLRTYAVVCLNEECGLLEWVNNTDCIRQIILKAHNYWPDKYPMLSYKDAHKPFLDSQKKNEFNIDALVQTYREIVTTKYVPCLHKWFIETFADPTEWLEARTLFTRSTAIWNGVGHVVGLGDRHTENILMDVTNGECVHVDFDCLFDKGLNLAKPEIIPFRLTYNIVDAMGPLGVEGTYRRTLEVCMLLLRNNKDILLSVLEPFLRDPTVAWNRAGRAQRDMDRSDQLNNRVGSSVSSHEYENKEANEMMKKISGRLSGVYNIVHPYKDQIISCYQERGGVGHPARGIGVIPEEMIPLSVQGQVQRLIDEATAIENLAQLYIGIV